MRSLLITLIVLAALRTTYAQYIVPPDVVMRFRIYGRDAERVVPGTPGYAFNTDEHGAVISAGLYGTDSDAVVVRKKGWHGPWFDLDEPESVRLTIVNGRDTMRIRSELSIDSLGFMAGSFFFPLIFKPLISGFIGAGVSIEPSLSRFRVASLNSAPPLRVISLDQWRSIGGNITPKKIDARYRNLGLPSQRIECVAHVPKSDVIILAIRRNDGFGSMTGITLHRKAYRDSLWTLVNEHIPAASIEAMHFDDELHGVILAKPQGEPPAVLSTSDGGVTWKSAGDEEIYRAHSTLVPLDDDTITTVSYLDPNVGFMAVSYLNPNDDVYTTLGAPYPILETAPCELRSTTDGGKSWKVLFRSPWNTRGAVRFFNKQRGIFVTSYFLLLTNDGGGRWEFVPYTPVNYVSRSPYPGETLVDPYAFDTLVSFVPRSPYPGEMLVDFFFVDEHTLCIYTRYDIMLVALDPKRKLWER